MAYQLFIGLMREGSTDERFLKEIIEKTFIEAASLCNKDVVIEDVYSIPIKGKTFVESALISAARAGETGIGVLCIHADADDVDTRNVLSNKFSPLSAALDEVSDEKYCKVIVPIIPVRMTEAWMMADKGKLAEQIGAGTLSLEELGLHLPPEKYSNPKESIKMAIVQARSHLTKRRRHNFSIDDLYLEMGQQISLSSLRQLSSFSTFESSVQTAFVRLGLMSGPR